MLLAYLKRQYKLLLLLAGAYFTVKTRFVQVRRFLPSVRAFFCGGAENGRTVSPFEAAATSLAATIGTGNIAGTAGAPPGDCWRRTIRRCCRQSAGTGPGWRRRMKAASGS